MSKKPPYTPQAGSLAYQIVQFFRDNPEEELSRRDIAAKFEVDANSIDGKLRQATETGVLATGNSSESGRVWRAGPQLQAVPLEAPKDRRPRATLPPLDLNSIAVESGVEKPKPKNANSPVYTALINKLSPGDSVLLHSEHAKRLIDLAKKLAREASSGAKYSLRKIDDTNTRVWRDG